MGRCTVTGELHAVRAARARPRSAGAGRPSRPPIVLACRRVPLCVALLIVALPLPTALADGSAAVPQTQAWQSRYDESVRRYRSRDYAASAAAAEAALDIARAGQGHAKPHVASSLNMMAMSFRAMGRTDEAIELFREALAISEASLGAHPDTGALALNLGQALEAGQRGAEALVLYRRALAIAEAASGGESEAGLRQKALAALARAHAAAGDVQAAADHDRRLLSNRRSLPAPERIEGLVRQARWLEGEARLDEAQAALTEALAVRQEAFGVDSLSVAQGLADLAGLYHRRERHDLGEPLHRRAVAIREAHDPNDPALAGHLNELALWHLARGEYGPAQASFERAQALVERARGTHSLEAARIAASRAQLHDAQGKHDEAQALHQQALQIYRRLDDAPQVLLEQAGVLNHLAGYPYRKRQFKEAEPLFREALAMMEQVVGTEDVRLLPVLENLRALCLSQKRHREAAQFGARIEALEAK